MPEHDKELHRLLSAAGFAPQTVDAVMRVDAVTQNWRRRMSKRELGRRAVATLGLKLELAQLDVLFAIAAPHLEFGESSGETMVSTVAERLVIDPSRASRLVAEMVGAGYAIRTVSQADARRTVLELTPAGWAVVRAVQSYKWLLMGDYFAGWTEAELSVFVPLLERFSDWSRESGRSEARFSGAFAALTKAIEDVQPITEPEAS